MNYFKKNIDKIIKTTALTISLVSVLPSFAQKPTLNEIDLKSKLNFAVENGNVLKAVDVYYYGYDTTCGDCTDDGSYEDPY